MNDDTLILYYLNDGLTRAERREVTEALAGDPDVAARYAALAAELESLREAQPTPIPDDVRRRLHDTLELAAGIGHRAAPAAAPRPKLNFFSFSLGAAVAAALALGIGIGSRMSGETEVAAPTAVAGDRTDAASAPVAFERGLRVHFRASKRGLEAMPDDDANARAALVTSLIAQNGLYAELAERNDSPELARVLRAFDPILRKLAAQDISPEEAAALRAKLEFEINVMLTRLMRESSESRQSDEQEI
jgi:anti-sigma factor RsiW